MVPVGLGIVSTGNSKVLSLASNGPSGLGDPNILAANGTLGVVQSLVEESSALADAIGLSVLEVWVGINTDPVAGVDNGVVGSVDPGGPGIDMTNTDTAQGGARDSSSNLFNVVDDSIRVSSNGGASSDTGRRVSVEILTSYSNTSNAS